MRLRTKYVAVLVVVLVVLGTVVVGAAETFKSQAVASEQADLDRRTEIAAQQIDAAVFEQGDLLSRYAASLDGARPAASDQQLGQLVNATSFAWVAVVAENGTVVDVRGDVTDVERRAVGRPVDEAAIGGDRRITDTLENGLRLFTDPTPVAWGETEQSHLVNVSVPISQQGRITGALVGGFAIRETTFFDAIAPFETDTATSRVVADRQGGGQTTLDPAASSFDETITSTAEIATTGWRLEVRQDRGLLTERLAFLQFVQVGSLVVVLLSMLGLGVYQYRTTLRQTDRLLAGFEALRDGDFDHRLDLAAAEEWTQISDGFNTMASGLRQRESELRERERGIREREQRLSVLTRVLRHNLQNDMAVIQGFAEVLPETESAERRDELAANIVDTAQKLVDHGQKARDLEEIIDNAEDGPVEMDLAREVEAIVADYEARHPAVTFEVEAPDEACALAVPRAETGVESLVENAVEHNDSDQPRVQVTVETVDDAVEVRVGDNGPGIPDYEEAVLAQTEETSLEHGSGIGLWLAYWAGDKSGGGLFFGESTAGGALVTLRFPACERPASADETEATLSI